MSSSTGESPVVARRRLRLALRGARESRRLTQGQVAEAMEWSLSKVMRIESGEVSVSATDLRALLAYLDITDDNTIEQLMQDARVSRRQRWFADARYREHLTTPLLQLIQFEAEATAVRYFSLVLVPGLLQTAAYASAVMHSYRGDLSEADISTRVEARLQRQRRMLDRPDPAECLVILDESVLYREVGGPAVMGEQLHDLLRLMEKTTVMVRIVPFAAAAPIALLGPFTLLELGVEDAVLYRESTLSDEIIQAPQQISRHRDIFEQLWHLALGDTESTNLIKSRAEAMLASARAQDPG